MITSDPSSAPHRYIAVEGTNGVGKSTVASYLADRLDAALLHFPPEWVRFRDETRLDEDLPLVQRLAYYLAGTLHLSHLVEERLTGGSVVCDRYLASVKAMAVADGTLTESEVLRLCTAFEGEVLCPDLTIVLTAGHESARKRLSSRTTMGERLSPFARRCLASPDYFHLNQKLISRYAAQMGPTARLDTGDQSVEDVCQSAWDLINGLT